MGLTPAELEQLDTLGYVVIRRDWLVPLTHDCMAAVDAVAEPRPEAGFAGDRIDGIRSLLPPVMDKSYWSLADHSHPFLQVCLHPECIAIGRQTMPLVGEPSEDFYMRNAGINDMGRDHSIAWHHDGSWAIEFMHYFSGSSVGNGCLRVVPGGPLP